MNQKKIVCIGDSLTAGYGVKTNCRWSNLLGNTLPIELINAGISGDTTAGMLARFYEMAIKHKPNYIIITGGTNDIWLNLTDNTIIGNILAMTRYAKHHNIIPIIGIPTPFFNQGHFTDESLFIDTPCLSKRIHSFQKTLKQFAIDDQQNCIDFALEMTPELFLKDGLHPNEKGHTVMTENAKLSLIRIFNQG